MSFRSEKVAEAIKKETSDILRNTIKDPRVGFASVTTVEVSGDLRYAKIFVSVYGTSDEQKATFLALESAKGLIRSELGKRLRLRYTPEIVFKTDTSIGHAARIMELIEKCNNQDDTKNE